MRLKYVTLMVLAVFSVIGVTGVFAQEYSDDDPTITTPDVFVTREMPIIITTGPVSLNTTSPVTSSNDNTTITDLKNQILSLKVDNHNLKQQITSLNNEIEQLEDILSNGLKEIYNWIYHNF